MFRSLHDFGRNPQLTHLYRCKCIMCMKDVYRIFDDGFQKMTGLDEIGFENCFRIASDLTKIAVYSDFKRGVLVAEVLEDVFGQVGPLFETYDIPEDKKKSIKDEIIQEIYSLASVYKGGSGGAVYDALADIRFGATRFQFECYTSWKRFPKTSRLPTMGAR